MTKQTQTALFVDRETQLWAVMEKVRESGVLSAEELVLLDEVVKANAPTKADDIRWLCAVWRGEFKKATLAQPPRLTVNELHALKDACKRVGGPAELGRLMPAFFAWRRWLIDQKAAAPQPTTIGFVKHLASLQEYAAKLTRAKAKRVQASDELLEAQRAAEASPVKAEDINRFRRQLEQPMTDEELNNRRQLLDAQVETLRQREAQDGARG